MHGGKEYFSILETLINEAEHEIHLQTYIFDNDQTGQHIANALKKAAQRGVEVYVILDSYGSKDIGKTLVHEMEEAGVNFRFFGFGNDRWNWGRRLHHKIIVADRCKALVGGINIADKYNDIGDAPPWLDFALLIEGPVCKEIFKICKQVFAQWFTLKRYRFRLFEKFTAENKKIGIQLRQNDWLRRKNQVARAYIKAIRMAKEEIIISNSYFLPGGGLRQALKKAVERGVKVKILLPGISDVPFAKQATNYLYAYFFRAGVEIYEWQPGILHAKVACVDGKWCTVGSYNLNYLSAYASIEFNLSVLNEGFCSSFQAELNSLIKEKCVQLIGDDFTKGLSPIRRFGLWLSYSLIRIAEGLLITFPGQRRYKNKYV